MEVERTLVLEIKYTEDRENRRSTSIGSVLEWGTVLVSCSRVFWEILGKRLKRRVGSLREVMVEVSMAFGSTTQRVVVQYAAIDPFVIFE